MTPSELKLPKKKARTNAMVAGSFAVVAVDAFVFGNASAAFGVKAYVAVIVLQAKLVPVLDLRTDHEDA